jgi:hypothetical protein
MKIHIERRMNMKLGSEECNEALHNYKTSNRSEELMIELLLIPEDADDETYTAMTYKICDELNEEEIGVLDVVVTRIRDELGIS